MKKIKPYVRAAKVLASALLAAIAGHAIAEPVTDFPDRPVYLVVPYPPGGGNDVIARIVAPKLASTLGKQIIIDNLPGAGGTIGTAYAARAKPNGYTVLIINTLPHTSAPGLYRHLTYDPIKDFTSVGMIGSVSYMLAVNKSVPAKTVAEFINLANQKPGTVTFESAGVGSATHLAGEFFMSRTKARLMHIPYKGGGPGMSDLLAGRVQSTFENVAVLTPFVQNGTLRGLALTGPHRSPLFPGLPTMAESGYPGFDVSGKFGLVVPAGTPAGIVAKLNQALNKALGSPDLIKSLATQGVEAQPGTPAQYDKLIKTESVKWLQVMKDAHIQPEN